MDYRCFTDPAQASKLPRLQFQAGIQARGRTAILRKNYRNTRQIAEAAAHLLEQNVLMRSAEALYLLTVRGTESRFVKELTGKVAFWQ